MIVKITLEEEDYAPLHDILFDLTDMSYKNTDLLKIWNELPEDIQYKAVMWGMSDTEVRESIYKHMEDAMDEYRKNK